MPTLDFLPFPLLIGVLVLVTMMVRSRRRGRAHQLGLALFGLYVLAVIGVLFFPIPLPPNWPANLTWRDTMRGLTQVNLIPFNYGTLSLTYAGLRTGALRDIVANILLTIPFGLGSCLLTPVDGKRVLGVALAVGLALEGTQLLMKLVLGVFIHAVDITDVLLNGAGVILGYWLCRGGKRVVLRARHA